MSRHYLSRAFYARFYSFLLAEFRLCENQLGKLFSSGIQPSPVLESRKRRVGYGIIVLINLACQSEHTEPRGRERACERVSFIRLKGKFLRGGINVTYRSQKDKGLNAF